MKKIVSLILAAAMAAMMLFAFASCGKKDDDTLVCGVTLVDRINYKDENGEWVGFDSDFAKECREIFAKAAAKRESWLVRVMTSDNKRAQGCLNALKQPQNGGYIDRPQDNGGEIKVTLNLGGVGGENAFK